MPFFAYDFQVPYRPYLRTQATIAIDAYLEVQRLVDMLVNNALRCNSPHWRLHNACASCTYPLEDKKKLKYSMLTQIDANNLLKCVERVNKEHDSKGHVIRRTNLEQRDQHRLDTDYYLMPEEVDKYKDEVMKQLPQLGTSVCSFILGKEAFDMGTL